MSALICGSMAFDTIMVFPDRFKHHLLPEQLHILNVSFLVPEMRRNFGGCAGNIAYNLKLLGDEPLIMATVGSDFSPYRHRLDQLGIRTDYLREISDSYTAQAFITTDLDDNQITAFHPGAMMFSHHNHVSHAQEASLVIVSPDGRDGMLQHARETVAAGLPLMFDPGQGMPLFNGDDLNEFIELASYITLNDYEAQLIQERTQRSLGDIARDVKALIVTLGSSGSTIYAAGKTHTIPCAPVNAVVDPTGCGDAYRAGLLYGIARQWDWQTTGQLAALLGAIKIEHQGGQNHHFTRDSLAARYQAAFDQTLPSWE